MESCLTSSLPAGLSWLDSSRSLTWKTHPTTVLILGKYFDAECRLLIEEIAIWLSEKNMNVMIPDELANDLPFPGYSSVTDFRDKIDFVVTLGGDGTLLYVNSVFPEKVPPVIPFNFGSLAFMAIFDVIDYKTVIQRVIDGHFPVLSRSRLLARIIRSDGTVGEQKFVILNEAVINNGPSGKTATLDTYCNGKLITTLTGDGLIVGTSTGSTAYNLAAGGSMVHPNVPAILFTPICPHSLSFRPVLLPATVKVLIKVPEDARIHGWVTFDGRNEVELEYGDAVELRMCPYPLWTVSNTDESSEWFSALADCLHWNVRKRQKPLPSKV